MAYAYPIMSDSQLGTFKYPGGKMLIRNWILQYFPNHTGYIEAFGGSASILANKERSEMEVYNDINGDCVNFFKAVRDRGDELAEWVDATPYSRELFNQYVNEYPGWPDDTVEQAGRFLYVQSAAFGGKLLGEETVTFSVTKPDNSQLQAGNCKIFGRKPEQIQRLKERFKGVIIESLDYEKLVKKYDREVAFFYFDPPYVDVGDDYYSNGVDKFDHARFVDTLEGLDCKWLVSYDHNIPERLEKYHIVSRGKIAQMSAQLPEKTESLVMNYNPEKVTMFSSTGQATLGEIEE